MDGYPAAASVVARKPAVLLNALAYAVDRKHLDTNPLLSLRSRSPETADAIDRRRVVSPAQAKALLDAVAGERRRREPGSACPD